MDEKEKLLAAMDVDDSYHLAKRMEQFKTNPVLGYRTAGSLAEFETGEMIVREMEHIGLSGVCKTPIQVDSWEFEKAVMRCRCEDGQNHEFQLGAYQTDFHTHGFSEYQVIDVGKGTLADYIGLDVTGKLVLADINQREEWWINFPVYQAHLKGAAALIAVQEGGFGEINGTALNAQDIAGPADAPAFSISRADAGILRRAMGERRELTVEFDAESTVKRNQISYNITGEIPGREPETMILLSAHYDSYFSGFQDDNSAVGMMLGIAKAMMKSGFRPQKTLVFCALAAEEWGVSDSKYDWSTGAYRQVFEARPDWQGRVVADLNFELPAHAHGRKDSIRSVYEYIDFLEEFLNGIEMDYEAYPEGIELRYPIQTMSDDFSMAIAGIPSMVNDFTSGSFMETHYHSQFDNEEYYQEVVYAFHHRLYASLALEFDRTAVAPLNFARLFAAMEAAIEPNFPAGAEAENEELRRVAAEAGELGQQVYEWCVGINRGYRELLEAGCYEDAVTYQRRFGAQRMVLMKVFRKAQDSFVRLNWQDEVLFPQEAVGRNLRQLQRAQECLEASDIYGALDAIYQIDNNRYAFLFQQEVFDYFTDYVFNQPKERLLWGAGRIVRHGNLFTLVQSLRGKLQRNGCDVNAELEQLRELKQKQLECYHADVKYMIRETENIIQHLKGMKEVYHNGESEFIQGEI